jgi:hypothetical protein
METFNSGREEGIAATIVLDVLFLFWNVSRRKLGKMVEDFKQVRKGNSYELTIWCFVMLWLARVLDNSLVGNYTTSTV